MAISIGVMRTALAAVGEKTAKEPLPAGAMAIPGGMSPNPARVFHAAVVGARGSVRQA